MVSHFAGHGSGLVVRDSAPDVPTGGEGEAYYRSGLEESRAVAEEGDAASSDDGPPPLEEAGMTRPGRGPEVVRKIVLPAVREESWRELQALVAQVGEENYEFPTLERVIQRYFSTVYDRSGGCELAARIVTMRNYL